MQLVNFPSRVGQWFQLNMRVLMTVLHTRLSLQYSIGGKGKQNKYAMAEVNKQLKLGLR